MNDEDSSVALERMAKAAHAMACSMQKLGPALLEFGRVMGVEIEHRFGSALDEKMREELVKAWLGWCSYGERLRFHAMTLGGTSPLAAIVVVEEDRWLRVQR